MKFELYSLDFEFCFFDFVFILDFELWILDLFVLI